MAEVPGIRTKRGIAFSNTLCTPLNTTMYHDDSSYWQRLQVCMPGCKNHGLWFPLTLHDGGSGLRLNDIPDIKL